MFDVSIIMPVYNVADYLPRAIESALAQRNGVCEIILVNDGSTDSSGEICDEYAQKEPLLITVIHQENQGSGPARNAGLKQAKGDYIYFADPDDYFDNYLVADNSRIARNKQPDTVVFGYTQEKAGESNNREVHLPNLPQLETQEAIRNHFRNIYHFSPYALWNKLYRREFLKENNIQFGTQRQGQDALFNIEVYKHIESIAVNRKAYYHYVSHEGSAVNSYRTNRYEMEKNIAEHFEALISEWDANETFGDLIAEEYFHAIYLETANLVHPDCPYTTEEKISRLSEFWQEIGPDKIRPFKTSDTNPFRYALLFELKKNNARNALVLMKTRNTAAKNYSRPFQKVRTFFKN